MKPGRSIFLMATKLLHMTSPLTLLHFCPDLLGKVLQDVDEIRVLRSPASSVRFPGTCYGLGPPTIGGLLRFYYEICGFPPQKNSLLYRLLYRYNQFRNHTTNKTS